MGKPFRLDLVMDVRDVIRASRAVSGSLDDTADALDALARDSARAGDRVSASLNDSARDAHRAADHMGDAFTTASRSADRSADQIGDSFTGAAHEATRAAARLEKSFRDALSDVSTQAKRAGHDIGQHLDDGAAKARHGLQDVGDEAKDTARETAASLGNFLDDAAGAAQELAANIGAMFGPLGLGIGAALSAGVAIWQQRVEEIKETARGLLDELFESGGRVTNSAVQKHLQELGTDILRYKRIAEDAKIPVEDFLLAVAGDPSAIERTNRALDDQWRAFLDTFDATEQWASSMDDARLKASAARDALGKNAEAASLAASAYRTHAEAAAKLGREQERAILAVEAYGDALDAFADPAAVYADLQSDLTDAERARVDAATTAGRETADANAEMARKANVSIGQYLDALDAQVRAQENWQQNMVAIAKRVTPETLAELAKLGPGAAPLIAQLAAASDAELKRMEGIFVRRGTAATDGFGGGLTSPDAVARLQANALRVANYARGAMAGKPVVLPVDFDRDSAAAAGRGAAAVAWRSAQNYWAGKKIHFDARYE